MPNKAYNNSPNRFTKEIANQRRLLAKKIVESRQRDRQLKYHERRGWGRSFIAGLEDLNYTYYSPVRIEDLLNEQIENLKKLRILEIGCGLGGAASNLVSKYGDKIEMHASGVAYLPEWKKIQNGSKINWHVTHAENLSKKFAPESLDFIHSNLGFTHTRSIEKAFEEISAILKPGGIFLFTGEGGVAIPPNFEIVQSHHKKVGLSGLPLNIYLLRKLPNKH